MCLYSADGRSDRVKLLIEVKSRHTTALVNKGASRMHDYLDLLKENLTAANTVGRLRGVLICGVDAFFYHVNPHSGLVERTNVPAWEMRITSMDFWVFLHSCAHGQDLF